MIIEPPEHPRVAAMRARFVEIDSIMRPLPLYNPVLHVATHGFSPWEDALLGILVTPWFMNLVVLPQAPEPIDPTQYGEASTLVLPGGETRILYNGDPEIGAFRAASLHSPMDIFKSHAQAMAEARLRLQGALTPPDNAEPDLACPARRSFLGGGRRRPEAQA